MSNYLLSSRSEHRSATTMTAMKSVLTPLAGERKSITDISAPASPASTSCSSSSSSSSSSASPLTNNTSSTTKNGIRRKKKVNFLIKVEVQHVVLRSEIPKEEFEAAWYSPKEYKAMKKGLIPIIKKMAKGLPTPDDDECTRGLEHKTPQGSKKRCDNRYIAMDAVLQEQDRQWEFQKDDPSAISKIYNQSSAHCSMQAYLTAKADEEYVLKEVRGIQEGDSAEDDEKRDDVDSSPTTKDEDNEEVEQEKGNATATTTSSARSIVVEEENAFATKPVVAPPAKMILGMQTTRVLSAAA